jgi:nucleoside 2-deoxyribosyltransferase
MNIYFTGAPQEGSSHATRYADIAKLLSVYGIVATGSDSGQQLVAQQETQPLDERDIFEQNMSWLAEADVVVAEVSVPSMRVGYELAHAEIMEKPIVCLYTTQSGSKLPTMLSGNANLEVQAYETMQDAAEILEDFLKSN